MNNLSENHEIIENYVINKLETSGWKVLKFTYHEFDCHNLIEQLQQCSTPECMFIRTLPDILAIRENKSLFIEIKSKSPKYNNLALELYPLMVNYYLEKIGLNVIYVYGYKGNQGEIRSFYFSPEEITELVKRVIITDKCTESMKEILGKFSSNILKITAEQRSQNNIKKRQSTSENVGSGDPFVLIPEDKLENLKEFEIVNGEIKDYEI